VDAEELISFVFNERALWDIKNKHYNNMDISKKLRAQTGNYVIETHDLFPRT
jgi:hypothetical protein